MERLDGCKAARTATIIPARLKAGFEPLTEAALAVGVHAQGCRRGLK
jgi:hypothetical protein